MAIIDGRKTIHFGAAGMSDYTIHKDDARKERYIARHKNKEDWTRTGINSAGWWSRFYLWEAPTKEQAYAKIKQQLRAIL
jgi:hypothetical protein